MDKLYFTNQEKLDKFYQGEYLKEYYKDGKDDILFNFKNKMPYQEIRKERISDYIKNDSRFTVLSACHPIESRMILRGSRNDFSNCRS